MKNLPVYMGLLPIPDPPRRMASCVLHNGRKSPIRAGRIDARKWNFEIARTFPAECSCSREIVLTCQPARSARGMTRPCSKQIRAFQNPISEFGWSEEGGTSVNRRETTREEKNELISEGGNCVAVVCNPRRDLRAVVDSGGAGIQTEECNMNPITIFVVWVLMIHPWSFGPIQMTPGWVSKGVLWDQEGCDLAVKNLKFLNPSGKVLCLPGGQEPVGPMSQPISREQNDENGDREELKDFRIVGELHA